METIIAKAISGDKSSVTQLYNINKDKIFSIAFCILQDKDKAEKRLHIINGLIVAIDKIDEVITLIKNSNNKSEARSGLMSLLNVDEIQADAILDMKLAKLTRIDKNELIQEKKEKEDIIEECNRIIGSQDYRFAVLGEKIAALRDKYGDARRTKLTNITEDKEEKEIEFVEPEQCVVIMTEGGSIKRIASASFRTQRRNGKGVKTQDDITHAVIRTNTIDSLMIFSNKGKMYRLLVNDIPLGTNVSKGVSIKSLVEMESDEKPEIIYSIYRDTDAKYVLFVTKNGLVKKTSLEEYIKTKKKSGVIAISLKEEDQLAAVSLIKDENVVLVTNNGMALKFDSNEIGATARATSGLKGISLNEGDYIVSALPIRNENDKLALFTFNGLAKKFSLDELPIQKRNGKGLMCYKPTEITGKIVTATLIEDEDNILILGDKSSICIEGSEIPNLSRPSVGNSVIKNNKILSVSKV
jgi:DNA gyrase subunit A